MNTSHHKYEQPSEHVCVECVITWLVAAMVGPVAVIALAVWCYRSFIA